MGSIGDNDISADAGQGNGGNVNITANIIGLIQQDRPTSPQSGITASSDQGLNGIITTSSPEFDPTRGLLELPTEVVDASRFISSTCRSGSSNDPKSAFFMTGRGGLPPSPIDFHQSNAVQTTWVSLPARVSSTIALDSPEPFGTLESFGTADTPSSIVEAQGWIVEDNSEIVLVAQATTLASPGSSLALPACNAL